MIVYYDLGSQATLRHFNSNLTMIITYHNMENCIKLCDKSEVKESASKNQSLNCHGNYDHKQEPTWCSMIRCNPWRTQRGAIQISQHHTTANEQEKQQNLRERNKLWPTSSINQGLVRFISKPPHTPTKSIMMFRPIISLYLPNWQFWEQSLLCPARI